MSCQWRGPQAEHKQREVYCIAKKAKASHRDGQTREEAEGAPSFPWSREGAPDYLGSPQEGEQEQGKKCEPGEGLWELQSSLREGEALRTRVLKVWKNLLQGRKEFIPCVHDKKLKVCVTAMKPGWILGKKCCPSKGADAQEEVAQEPVSLHPRRDRPDKHHQE